MIIQRSIRLSLESRKMANERCKEGHAGRGGEKEDKMVVPHDRTLDDADDDKMRANSPRDSGQEMHQCITVVDIFATVIPSSSAALLRSGHGAHLHLPHRLQKKRVPGTGFDNIASSCHLQQIFVEFQEAQCFFYNDSARWFGPDLQCHPIDCGTPEDILNGKRRGECTTYRCQVRRTRTKKVHSEAGGEKRPGFYVSQTARHGARGGQEELGGREASY